MLLINYLNNFKKKITDIISPQAIHIIKHFCIYSCGSLLVRSISFFLLPITLTLLNPSDFGLLSLVTNFNNICVIFLGLGFRQMIALEYFHHNKLEQQVLINRILALYLCFSIPCLLLLSIFASKINFYIFSGNASSMLIFVCIMYCFLHFFAELFYQILQYEDKALQLISVQCGVALLSIMLNLFFLFHGFNVTGIICSSAIALLCVFLIGLRYYCKNTWHTTFNFKQSSQSASYFICNGLPFIPSMLFAWVLAASDRWILLRYTCLHEVGIYNLADTFSVLFQFLVLYPLSGSYLPFLQKKFAQNHHDIFAIELKNRKIMFIALFSSILLIIGGSFIFKPLIKNILPLKYENAIQYIWILLLGNVFLMGSYFSTALIQFKKKTHFLASALCVPAFLNIFLNYVLIPKFHIYGCAFATMVSYFIYWLLTVWYSTKLLKKYALINN